MLKLMVIGNLTRDPETRVLQDGRMVTNFTVASNRRGAGGDHPAADYVRVAAWDALGENCAKYLNKGKKVYVSGTVQARGYTTNDGHAAASLELTAREVEFLSPKGEAAAEPEKQEAEGYTPVEMEEQPF